LESFALIFLDKNKVSTAPYFRAFLVSTSPRVAISGLSPNVSKAEQETLAIIAFKQPIKQSVMIKIRGNKAYDHVKKFSDLGLIKKKKMGHTSELSLRDDFYDYFGVKDSNNPLQESLKTELTEK